MNETPGDYLRNCALSLERHAEAAGTGLTDKAIAACRAQAAEYRLAAAQLDAVVAGLYR